MSDFFRTLISVISLVAIPLVLLVFLGWGLFKKVKVYEVFVEGAKDGFNVAIRIIPYLVAMLAAIGIFRASGALELLISVLTAGHRRSSACLPRPCRWRSCARFPAAVRSGS